MKLKNRLGLAGSLSLVGVALSFLSQLIFSYYFGTSAELDAYWIAFAIMNFLSFPLTALREALVSEIHELSLADKNLTSIYFSKALSLIIFTAIFLALFGLFLSDPLINLVAGDGKPVFHTEVYAKLLWLAPALILLALSDTFNSLLTSYNRVTLQMVSRILAAGSTIAVIAFSAAWMGSQALVFGFVIGQAINTVVLGYVLHRQGLFFKPFHFGGLGQDFLRISGALICSYGLSQIYALYEKAVFLNFGVGLVSAFQYSVSVTNIVITVFGLSLANLLWPRFLKYISDHNYPRLYDEVAISSKLLFIILGWICALVFLNAQWIVEIIFARGAFGEDATTLTTL